MNGTNRALGSSSGVKSPRRAAEIVFSDPFVKHAGYRRALEIRRAKLEPDHPDLRDAHRQYAALLRAAGRGAEAEALGSAPPG